MEHWILAIRTSLPNTCLNHKDLRSKCMYFDTFQKAKAALRKQLKDFAFSPNAMFNGEGHLIQLNRYIANSYEQAEPEEYEEFRDNGWLTGYRLATLQEALTQLFSGEDRQLPLFENGVYENGTLSLHVYGDRVHLNGWNDGIYHGYDPLVCTNMFNMVQEGDYYLYLDDMFGQDDCSAELYIDLKKAKMQ